MNRSTHARATAGTVLFAGLAGAALAAFGGTPPAATRPRHASYSGIGLAGGVTPRRVTLTSLSAERLGVSAAPVAAVRGGAGGVEIPLTALIYDPEGASWTYVVVGPRAYERVAVMVAHIDGDRVVLAAGPPVGTPVVTVGGMELLGVEYGVGEE